MLLLCRNTLLYAFKLRSAIRPEINDTRLIRQSTVINRKLLSLVWGQRLIVVCRCGVFRCLLNRGSVIGGGDGTHRKVCGQRCTGAVRVGDGDGFAVCTDCKAGLGLDGEMCRTVWSNGGGVVDKACIISHHPFDPINRVFKVIS